MLIASFTSEYAAFFAFLGSAVSSLTIWHFKFKISNNTSDNLTAIEVAKINAESQAATLEVLRDIALGKQVEKHNAMQVLNVAINTLQLVRDGKLPKNDLTDRIEALIKSARTEINTTDKQIENGAITNAR